MSDTYYSIAQATSGSYREKASKFIALAFPVSTEEEVRIRLENVRKEYHDANHHCFAYRLGNEQPIYRFNDDREPSGSAGKPIYGQILSKNLSDILVIVIRYFGGTKLGIPGLIRAYRTAAREAIEAAVITEKVVEDQLTLNFPYRGLNEVMTILKEHHVRILAKKIEQECMILCAFRKDHMEKIRGQLMRITNLSISLHSQKTAHISI